MRHTPKTLTFYLDFISPYAWLAFDALPQALEGLDVQVVYKPVLFRVCSSTTGSWGRPKFLANVTGPTAKSSGWRDSKGVTSSYPSPTHSIPWPCCAWPWLAMHRERLAVQYVSRCFAMSGAALWRRPTLIVSGNSAFS